MPAEPSEFEIQLLEEYREDWKKLAIELIKQGYSVCLFQDKSKLMVKRAWYYSKVSN